MRKVGLISLVLCVLLLFSACGSGSRGKGVTAKGNENVVQKLQWSPVYNNHQCGLLVNQTLPDGVTQKALTEQQVASLLPVELAKSMKTVGFAYMQNDGAVYGAVLQIRIQEGQATVALGSNAYNAACCASLSMDAFAETSVCGNVEFYLYQKIKTNGMTFIAKGELNGIPVLVRIESKEPARDKIVFESILESFSRAKGDSLSFAAIEQG